MQKAAFEDILEKEGKLLYKTRGTSMLPLLHQEQDLVILEKPEKAPDICVRVLRFKENGVEE